MVLVVLLNGSQAHGILCSMRLVLVLRRTYVDLCDWGAEIMPSGSHEERLSPQPIPRDLREDVHARFPPHATHAYVDYECKFLHRPIEVDYSS